MSGIKDNGDSDSLTQFYDDQRANMMAGKKNPVGRFGMVKTEFVYRGVPGFIWEPDPAIPTDDGVNVDA